MRNPWRFTFDTATGDLWVADVGQDDWEEVNRLPAVGRLRRRQGRQPRLERDGGHPSLRRGREPGRAPCCPIHEYGHDSGCSVIGGYVYRGEEIPGLEGVYLFAD